MSCRSTAQTPGRFSVLLKSLAVFGMTLAMTPAIFVGVRTISASTICLSVMLPSKIGGKIHQPRCERGG